MSNTTIRARSLPYREPRPKTYTCHRCGIERPSSGKAKYCTDCRPHAVELGWITRNERKAA